MKIFSMYSNPMLVLMLLFSTYHSNGQTEKSLKGSQPHPVERLYRSSIEIFNQGDLDGFLSNFAPGIKMYGTDGTYFGRKALNERFAILFDRFPKMRMEIVSLTLDELTTDVVLVHFDWKLYPMGQGPSYSGIGSGVYRIHEGKWEEILEVETVTKVDEALRQNR